MRSLASLVVASALLGLFAPLHAAPAAPSTRSTSATPSTNDRHACIAPVGDDAAAPSLTPNALAPGLVAAPTTLVTPVFFALPAPRPVVALAATLPLYLRDRALRL